MISQREEFAPEFTSQLHAQTANEGETVKLECAVAGEGIEVKWYKGDKEIKPDARHEIQKLPDGTQRLVIKEANQDDIGDYRVEAVNPAGSAESQAPLMVQRANESIEPGAEQEAPEFIEKLSPVSVSEGENTTLQCRVHAEPAPEVYWMKNMQKLTGNESHVTIEATPEGRQKLTISNATIEDAAKYRCVAENVVGKATTEAFLEVKGKQDQL